MFSTILFPHGLYLYYKNWTWRVSFLLSVDYAKFKNVEFSCVIDAGTGRIFVPFFIGVYLSSGNILYCCLIIFYGIIFPYVMNFFLGEPISRNIGSIDSTSILLDICDFSV